MFTKRSLGGIFFTYDRSPGQKRKMEVVAGDSVTLQKGDERLLIRSVIPTTMGHFKATVYGFDPGVAFQEIEFDEAHIFGCEKAA